MKKNLGLGKNLLLFSLLLSIGFSNVTSTYANVNSKNNIEFEYNSLYPEINLRILNDDGNIRTVETYDSDAKYIVTYNKDERTMDVIIHKLNNNTKSVISTDNFHIDLEQIENSYKISEDGKTSNIFEEGQTRASIYQNTYSNYEYEKTYGSTNKWELRRPDPSNPVFSTYYFTTNETSENAKDLQSFMDYVEKINSQEVKVIFSIGASVFSDILLYMSGIGTVFTGGTLTPAMVTAAAAAVGANGLAVSEMVTLGSYWNYAYNYYFEVYKNKE